ncbi:hypothetical protein F4775DRAFT_304347 [Biscogniauxia sp. FL1348]|nr:hypothetical protein F4775DRAFT_304347 [Biscogniauxia sp. FL1348]
MVRGEVPLLFTYFCVRRESPLGIFLVPAIFLWVDCYCISGRQEGSWNVSSFSYSPMYPQTVYQAHPSSCLSGTSRRRDVTGGQSAGQARSPELLCFSFVPFFNLQFRRGRGLAAELVPVHFATSLCLPLHIQRLFYPAVPIVGQGMGQNSDGEGGTTSCQEEYRKTYQR